MEKILKFHLSVSFETLKVKIWRDKKKKRKKLLIIIEIVNFKNFRSINAFECRYTMTANY